MFRRVAAIISTRPPTSSYVWGGRRSPLAIFAFFGVYLLRLLSPLQWIKAYVRRRSSHRTSTNRRPDFPAAYTEIYFLAVTTTALILTIWTPQVSTVFSTFGSVVAILLLIESVNWFIYYVLFRGFFERSYTIFHPAEYLLMFPLVLCEQILLFDFLAGRSAGETISNLVGNVSTTDPLGLAVALMGLVYLGVGISILLTTHPGIHPRLTQTISVIGAGEIVLTRVLPALRWLGYQRGDIVVASPATTSPKEANRFGWLEISDEDTVLDLAIKEEGATIIASPTFAHFRQIVALAGAGIPFAVEKPIVASKAQRQVLRDQGESLMRNGFALSYYSLEKALPLTYLFRPLPIYEQFLTLDGRDFPGNGLISELQEGLGPLESVTLALLEGEERSPKGRERLWTETPDSLHTFVETSIHPLLMLRRLLQTPDSPLWNEVRVSIFEPRKIEVQEQFNELIAPTFVSVNGQADGIEINMRVGKYVPEPFTERRATLNYSSGRIECDFDQRSVCLFMDAPDPSCELAVKKEFPHYSVQLSLFMQFAANGWGSVRFDDFELQLDALDWWDAICLIAEEQNLVPIGYDRTSPAESFN